MHKVRSRKGPWECARDPTIGRIVSPILSSMPARSLSSLHELNRSCPAEGSRGHWNYVLHPKNYYATQLAQRWRLFNLNWTHRQGLELQAGVLLTIPQQLKTQCLGPHDECPHPRPGAYWSRSASKSFTGRPAAACTHLPVWPINSQTPNSVCICTGA